MPEITKNEIEPRWYILHCYSGQEDRVKKNLDQRVETMGLHKNCLLYTSDDDDE